MIMKKYTQYIVCSVVFIILLGLLSGCRAPQQEIAEPPVPPAYRFEGGVERDAVPGYPFVYAGIPRSNCEYTMLENIATLVAYDETRKNPAWVAYYLPGPTMYTGHKRIRKFSVDERTCAKVSHSDYTHSGYSRGHMAPSYNIFSRYGREAQKQTYLMSNVCPQLQWLNGGPWNELESRIARTENWARQRCGLWIITGPVYEGDVEKLPSGVEIPDAFFKIVLDIDEEAGNIYVLSFLMTHGKKHNKPLREYLVSVDNIELLTGLDFFHALEDDVEDSLEAAIPTSLWGRN
jgi:endonuclease G